MKEFSLIESLSNMLGNSGIALGVGDDAALFGDTLVAKDIMAENIHFTHDAPFSHVLKKLLTSNVSDIAAMGGTAQYALLGIAVPHGRVIDPKDIIAPFEAYGIKLIGGDTTSSDGGLFVSITIIGKRNEHVVTRSGAKNGDRLFLSRPVGRVRQLLERELKGDKDNYNHYLVRAESGLGELLGTTGYANSCIDVSDGVGRDASHIADMSKVKIVIEKEKVPVDHLEGISEPVLYALGSGEEFALLFTVPKKYASKIKSIHKTAVCIGYVEKGEGVFLKDGENYTDISTTGWEHTF